VSAVWGCVVADANKVVLQNQEGWQAIERGLSVFWGFGREA